MNCCHCSFSQVVITNPLVSRGLLPDHQLLLPFWYTRNYVVQLSSGFMYQYLHCHGHPLKRNCKHQFKTCYQISLCHHSFSVLSSFSLLLQVIVIFSNSSTIFLLMDLSCSFVEMLLIMHRWSHILLPDVPSCSSKRSTQV